MDLRNEEFDVLYQKIKENNFDLEVVIKNENDKYSRYQKKIFENIFNVDFDSFNGNINGLEISKELMKIRYLSNYLEQEKNISLATALSFSEKKTKQVLNGVKKPNEFFIHTLCSYFSLQFDDIKNDEIVLPKYEDLKIDEEIYAIQNESKESRKTKKRMRFYEEFRLISRKKKRSLFRSLLAITIPLIAYISVCSYLIINEKVGDIKKYEEGSRDTLYDETDSYQTSLYEELKTSSKEENADAYYCDVNVGTKIYKIYQIYASSSSYVAQIELFFTFNKDEFAKTFSHYAENVLLGNIIDEWLTLSSDNTFTENSLAEWKENHEEYFADWVNQNCRNYYPGEVSSNVYTDKQEMFSIGNGLMVSDSLTYKKDLEEYMDLNKETNKEEIYCYQKMFFEAKFSKSFDSYRYPLENIQFKMYIQPTMDAQYIRYIPNLDTNSNEELLSGVSPYFSIAGGYKLVENTDKIKNFSLKLNYYKDVNNDPSIDYPNTIKTQLEICLRAKRSGMSLFLKAFINLFSVVIWITIAFYNQTYNKEDSLGMLGTGLFGVISSILVGLSLISDAGIFSLVTMINVFTLAVIMIMTYESIVAKRANVLNNKMMVAYNSIKLKILFYVLIVCTLIMFIGLPLISWL